MNNLTATNPLFEEIATRLRAEARSGSLPRHLEQIELTPTTKLGDLGIDSLGKMALLAALMEISDKYFPDDTFRDEHTLGEIAEIASGA